MIVGGKKVSANQALEDGLLDEISNKPPKSSEVCLRTSAVKMFLFQDENSKTRRLLLSKKIECYIEKKSRQIAPKKAIELVCLSCKADFQSGVIAERKIFLNVRQSPQANQPLDICNLHRT